MAKQFFNDGRISKGFSFNDYMMRAVNKTSNPIPEGISEEDIHLLEYTKLNIKRSERVEKTYTVGEELKEKLLKISSPQIWMVITEAWCGDSAQNLPYIAKMAAINPLIDFKIILRDENPDIMDEYLTNGTKSIPILVAFDESGNELFKWGPRPVEAADLVKNAKAEGKSKDQFIEELHLWYGRNRGKALESEFLKLI